VRSRLFGLERNVGGTRGGKNSSHILINWEQKITALFAFIFKFK